MMRAEVEQMCGSVEALLEALGIADVEGAEREVLAELEGVHVTMRKSAYCAIKGDLNAASYESPMAALVSLFKDRLWHSSPMMTRTIDGRFVPVPPHR